MRLIDADALQSRLDENFNEVYKTCDSTESAEYLACLAKVDDWIDEAPSVEAVTLDALCEFLAGYAVAPQFTGAKQMIHYTIPNEQCWESFLREMFIENQGGAE